MKKSTTYLISFLVITLIAVLTTWSLINTDKNISTFEECAKSYAVQSTYPARCVTKAGKVFTEPTRELTTTPTIGMANPASLYCERMGGTLKIVEEEPGLGGQVGLCTLPNGHTCEEWTLYRGDCQ